MTSSDSSRDDLRAAQIAFANDDFADAFARAGHALARFPDSAEARLIRINSALKLERWVDAIPHLESLLAVQPDHAKLKKTLSFCWLRIGNVYKAEAIVDAASHAYRKAIDADADSQDARFNLGVLLLENNRASEAIVQLRRLIDAAPADSAAALKLAEAYVATGENAAAVAVLDSLAARPSSRERSQQCCKLLLQAGARNSAKLLAQRVIEEHAEAGAWGREFCRLLRADGDVPGSRDLLDILRRRTQDPAEWLRLDLACALGLPPSYPDATTLKATREEFLLRLDGFVAAYPAARIAAIAPPPDALLWDNFYLAYQGEDDREPQSRFGDWLSSSLRTFTPAVEQPSLRAAPRLRIAVVSSRLHECTVGSYFSSWIEHLSTCGWELILVHVGAYRDSLTERLAKSAHAELTLNGDIVENAHKLREIGANLILYPELGMDYRTLALAAQRLAPHQVCAWGHPVTTGLPTIDVFVSCTEMEPVGAPTHYRERLLTLPGLGTRYPSPEIPPAAKRAALGLPIKGALYLVPQSLFKLHPDNDAVFVDIAQRDAEAVLIFFTGIEGGPLRAFRERLLRAFQAAGVAMESHVLFLPIRSRSEYLRVNLACDVMVDSLHWSGGNTSLDALHAGLPVVTSPGRFMRGRQSMAMLQRLDCAELVADSPQQLAALAVEIAHDHSHRDALSARIRRNLPALAQSDEPLHALDAALKSIVTAA
jgi:predicted O-linked N-acetylglucosamine transferase (SPINDLY family)